MIGFEQESIGFEEFIEKVKKGVQTRIGEAGNVIVRPVNKLNGTILFGLSIERRGTNIIPTIYLENFYDDYLKGKTLSNIVDRIIATDESAKYPDYFNINFFEKYENVKSMLSIKLINAEANAGMLEDVPHRKILDLAIIAYVAIYDKNIGEGGITVHNNHAMMWGKTAEEVIDDAIENAPNITPAECVGMIDLLIELKERSGDDLTDEMKRELKQTDSSMMVLTNVKRTHGAAVMAYKGLLEGLAEKIKSDFLILPSSIHELIVVPCTKEVDITMINPTIKQINDCQVPDGEILSNHAYLYNLLERRLISVEG